MKILRGLEIYSDVRMFHKNEFYDFWDTLFDKRLPKSEVTTRDINLIKKEMLEIQEKLYKIEKILVREKYV